MLSIELIRCKSICNLRRVDCSLRYYSKAKSVKSHRAQDSSRKRVQDSNSQRPPPWSVADSTPSLADNLYPLSSSSSPNSPLPSSSASACPGCGAVLQCDNERRIGFIPRNRIAEHEDVPDALKMDKDFQALLSYVPSADVKKEMNASSQPPICQRCWNLKHYNKVLPIELRIDDFLREIAPIREHDALIVKVVDIFDFDGSIIPNFRNYIGRNPVIICVNKSDLLPHGASSERILKWIRTALKAKNIRNVVAVHLISSVTGKGIKELAKDIEHFRGGLDVYVMGQSNVGKSSFINKLLDIFGGNLVLKTLTISNVPGTTMSTVGFPIGKVGHLYDTPGIMRPEDGLNWYLTPEEQKRIIPKVRVKPSVLRINPGTSFFIGALARVDYLEGPPLVFFTINVANGLYIHQVATDKAQESYDRMTGILLTPPDRAPPAHAIGSHTPPTSTANPRSHQNVRSSLNQQSSPLSNRVSHDSVLDAQNVAFPTLVPRPPLDLSNDSGLGFKQAFVDVVLHGLGWFSITGKDTVKIQIWYPHDCSISLRDPLMPFDSNLGRQKDPRVGMKRPAENYASRE